jgi:hypothetical protein
MLLKHVIPNFPIPNSQLLPKLTKNTKHGNRTSASFLRHFSSFWNLLNCYSKYPTGKLIFSWSQVNPNDIICCPFVLKSCFVNNLMATRYQIFKTMIIWYEVVIKLFTKLHIT